MKRRILTIRILILIVALCIIKLIYPTSAIKADVIEDSVSYKEIYNSRGDIASTIKMSKGVIKVETKAHGATTNIKWKLVGFTITRVPVALDTYDYEAEEGTYHLNGFKNVSTVYDRGYGTVWFKDGNRSKPTIDPNTGLTTTTTTIYAKQVEDALKGEKFSNIVQNTPIFLHGIFCVYTLDEKGKEILHTGETEIRNWKEILLAEWWDREDRQLEDFRSYFNMQIDFQPAAQDSTLYYYTEGKQSLGEDKKLDAKKPGENVQWSDEDAIKNDGSGKVYELFKYEVKRKGQDKVEQSETLNENGSNLAAIQSNETKVMIGGMNIYLYYRLKKDPTIVINAVDKKTNTIIQSKLASGTVTAGLPYINKGIPLTINHSSGVSYNRAGDFKYDYKKSSGTSGSGGGLIADGTNELKFTIPKDILEGSQIVVSVYYDAVIGDIPVTVIAVNKANETDIKTLTSGTVKGGGKFNYTAPENVNSGNKTYALTGDWTWQFTRKTTTSPTKKSGSGTTISFTAPASDKITSAGITVRVYYDNKVPGTNKINLRVIMVSESGALIEEISEETVTRGQAISKTIQTSRSVNKVVYDYLNRWECDYINSTGSRTIPGTGTTASFSIPASTSLGTTVTLKVYYTAKQTVVVPKEAAPISLSIDSPSPYGVINGDKYNGSYFTSEEGISTTESQYVYVKTKDYLLGYRLENRTGKVTFNVPVTMNYTLQYMTSTPVSAGGPKPVTEVVTDTKLIPVERAYSYWEIVNLDYYYVNSANVYNYSLPGGGVSLTANNTYLNIPDLYTWHSSVLEDHVLPPVQVTAGITLSASKPITSTTSDRPIVEYEDLTSYAIKMTGEARVKNDSLVFDGGTVLTDTIAEKITAVPNPSYLRHTDSIIHDKALYTEGEVIDAKKENGQFSSNGNVIYSRHPYSVNASYPSKSFNVDVNHVIIHTPVICEPVISSDNKQWSQVITPQADAVQIVLDPDNTLNDFSVIISNTLQHSSRLGYYARDFSRSYIDPANISYIARKDGIVRNEMKLPFDVYLDTAMDSRNSNDRYIKAGTWFVLGRDTFRFYVPMWVQEGIYTADFRTVAVNGTDKLSKTETTRNTSRSNYIATSTKRFQISGRIYGLTLYDVSDYPKWENVFRIKNTMLFKYFEGSTDGTKRTNYNDGYAYYYTVGTRNQYGVETGRYSKYTIPMVNSSHPKYKNLGVLKTGYAIRFMLDTTGEMYSNACQVKITPTFYYVDAEGKNRRQVDLYYDEEINDKYCRLVEVGEGLDLVNIQSSTTGNIYNRIPEAEIKNTAAVNKTTYSKIANQTSTMYSYSQIRLMNAFRTFIGKDYASLVTGLNSFVDVQTATGQTELNLSKYMQRWYGTYKLPVNVHAVASGYDVGDYMKKHGIDYKEDFWLTGGYIIVNFNIVTVDKNGKESLSYINGNNYLNNGNCSMWVKEGAPVQKTDSKGNVFNLRAGDCIVYYTDQKYTDDYEGKLY